MNEKKTAEIKNGTKMPIEDHQRILEDAHNYSDNMWRIEAYIAGGSKEYWRAAQETAALRDKLSALEMADNIMLKDLREQLNHEREENERLKEALKELIPIAMEAEQGIIGLSDRKRYQAQVRIENAKKLIGQL